MRGLKYLLCLVSLLCSTAKAYDPQEKIAFKPGTIPVLLTVPHDGDEMLGWVSPRKNGTSVRDAGTIELAEQTADLLERRLGGRPYIVIAKFSRKFADANRPQEEAYENAEAAPAYRAYHDKISEYVADIRKKFPAGGAILIDVHGQSDEPGSVFVGTRNGLTVRSLTKTYGIEALRGATSIAGELAAREIMAFPAQTNPDLKEDKRFNGGYTVFAYGSNNSNGIDAIQFEFGKQYRNTSGTAEKFADAITKFCGKYLPYFDRKAP